MTILFGGTFDPPHIGHMTCIEAALARFPEEDLVIIPAAIPAPGGQLQKIPVLPFEFRLALCQKSFSPLSERVLVTDVERNLPTPNYTIQTVEGLVKSKGYQKIRVLIGDDQFRSIDQWHRARELWSNVGIIVATRETMDHPFANRDSRALRLADMAKRMNWSAGILDNTVATWGPQNQQIVWLDQPIVPVSSSALRSILKEGRSVPTGWMSDNLEDQVPAIRQYFQK